MGSLVGAPSPPTPLIGRTDDIEAVLGLLARPAVRAVTLTGAAGVGKTRLAIEIGGQAARSLADGAVFIALADVRDPAEVGSVMLQGLGHADSGARPAAEVLVDLLADREILLVLDNFEQIIDAADGIARIASSCPGVRVLTTSRRPLEIRAEHCHRVAPLPVPASRDVTAREAREAGAVALLVSRLEAVDSRFVLTEAAAPVVVDICRRLDGLPLALELAAARARALPLPTILDALDRRLPLLTGGERDRPPRQRTMADAVAWSYELLGPREAAVFRRLGACVGGATLETVAALVADLGLADVEVFDALDALVSHSLLHRDGDARFRMLEVVREYAVDRLRDAGEAEACARRHSRHFLALSEQAAAGFTGAEQTAWLDRVQRERPNLAAAVRNAIEDGDADLALRLCLSLRFLWYVRGSIAEGRALFTAALEVSGASPPVRSRALVEASALARHQGALEAARTLAADGLAMARTLDDHSLLESALLQHGFVLHLRGEYGDARESLEESLAIGHAAGDALGVARATHHLGLVAYYGDAAAGLAWELQCRSLAVFRSLENRRHVAATLLAMVELARARGDLRAAQELLVEALDHVTSLDDAPLLVYALRDAAALAADLRHPVRAVRLLGAAEGLEHASGAAPWPAVAAGRERWLPTVDRRLGRRRVVTLLAAGARLARTDAVALAAATTDEDERDRLTRREHEIAAMVADGLTNRAIAERLVVSERTVDGHVARILAKLDFSSRSQIAAWVAAGARQETGT